MRMNKAGLASLKLFAVAAVALGLSERPASAQSVTADFSIPYEVSWGKSVLPAGDYTVTIESPHRPILVRSTVGGSSVLVLPLSVGKALSDQPTSLILTKGDNGRGVRALNLREANLSLGFALSKPESKVAARLAESKAFAGLAGK